MLCFIQIAENIRAPVHLCESFIFSHVLSVHVVYLYRSVCRCRRGWSRWCHSSKIVSLPLSMIVISSPRGSHRVVHWLRVDNRSRRTYVPVLFYLASQPTASIYVCASVGMLEENKRGENVKKRSLLLQMFYASHIMTRCHISPPSGYLLSHLQRVCMPISAVPTAKPAKPGALAPKDKPLKLEWQVEHFETTHTPFLTLLLLLFLAGFIFITLSFFIYCDALLLLWPLLSRLWLFFMKHGVSTCDILSNWGVGFVCFFSYHIHNSQLIFCPTCAIFFLIIQNNRKTWILIKALEVSQSSFALQ